MSTASSYLRRYGGYPVSILAIGALSYVVKWDDFTLAFSTANWALALAGALCVACAYATFAYRWKLLISHVNPMSYTQSFRNLMFGHMLNVVLPLRAGDIYRVNHIRQFPGWNGGRAVATLRFERIADVGTLSIVGLILLAKIDLPPEMRYTMAVLMSLILVFAVATMLLGRFKRLARYWAYRAGSLAPPKLAVF